MRSIIAPMVLVVLSGCASLQRPALAHRASVSAAACDSAASIASERAHLASVARTLSDMANGATGNAYSTLEPRVSTTGSSVARPSASGAAATSSMIANANNARVAVWYAEAGQDQKQYELVVGQIAALDAAARTLPTTKSCRAAGFAGFSAPAD